MGTFVTVTAVDESRDHTKEAIGRAFEEMDRLIAVFSRHDPTTPLSVLNQEGSLSDAPPELIDVIKRSLEFWVLSRGAFDVTVKPLIDLFERKHDSSQTIVATRDEVDAALERVGSGGLDISRSGVHFRKPGMGVTLDGVAKGYIVDCVSRVLAAQGIENHLINAGGDILTSGRPTDGAAWRVAVQDPEKKHNYPEVIELTSGAVATSGSYEVFFDKQKVFHHVVDPRTGWSPQHSASVSVLSDSVMKADALSTAIFVLRPTDGVGLIDTLDRSECLVVGGSGETYRSQGWKAAG
jgi:thiamine biosynthesis lipoprotein